MFYLKFRLNNNSLEKNNNMQQAHFFFLQKAGLKINKKNNISYLTKVLIKIKLLIFFVLSHKF